MDLVKRHCGPLIMRSVSPMSHVSTLIPGGGHHSLRVEGKFEPWSEFKICGFPLVHTAFPVIELTGHVAESSHQQLCSVHSVLFLSGIPPNPLLSASPLLRQQ